MIDTKKMYGDAAKGLGGTLRCSVCGHTQECTERDAARYLARGWPKCCGYTMSIEPGPGAATKGGGNG